jgi:signal transduction protein with GAF and PtsI domain
MALDTLSQVLKVDCCWIQTISDRKYKKLNLAAERGFSPEIRQEIGTMELGHSFSEQIIGMGHKIVIPDLSNDGLYGIPSFKNNGYKWLVAVPLMTYRVHGILGIASRNRRLLKKETADLIMTIAGLIATSLSKAHVFHQPPAPDKPTAEKPLSEPVQAARYEPKASTEKPAAENAAQVKEEPKKAEKKLETKPVTNHKEELKTIEKKPEAPVKLKAADNPAPVKPVKRPDGAFHSHARKMEQFRKSHG